MCRCGRACFATFFPIMYRANCTDTSDCAFSGLPDPLNTSALLYSACTLRLFCTEVVSPSFLGNLSLTLYVQDSCIVCVWHSPCVNVYVVRKAMSQKQATTTVMNPANSTRAIPKVTGRSGVLAGLIFLVGCMCPMECRLSSTATDYEKVFSGINLWKLHLRWSYFT